MIELIYYQNGFSIELYEIKHGKKLFIEKFSDREDLLIYIEENFEYAKLYCRDIY